MNGPLFASRTCVVIVAGDPWVIAADEPAVANWSTIGL
jgi:hypothetical protein